MIFFVICEKVLENENYRDFYQKMYPARRNDQ